MGPGLPLLRVGLPMVIATGVIQVLAQLALAHVMEILPSPPLSRYPKFFMLTHSVLAVLILLTRHILQVMIWALVYHYYWTNSSASPAPSISRWRVSPRSAPTISACRPTIAWWARWRRPLAC
jgi:hypothetical protein